MKHDTILGELELAAIMLWDSLDTDSQSRWCRYWFGILETKISHLLAEKIIDFRGNNIDHWYKSIRSEASESVAWAISRLIDHFGDTAEDRKTTEIVIEGNHFTIHRGQRILNNDHWIGTSAFRNLRFQALRSAETKKGKSKEAYGFSRSQKEAIVFACRVDLQSWKDILVKSKEVASLRKHLIPLSISEQWDRNPREFLPMERRVITRLKIFETKAENDLKYISSNPKESKIVLQNQFYALFWAFQTNLEFIVFAGYLGKELLRAHFVNTFLKQARFLFDNNNSVRELVNNEFENFLEYRPEMFWKAPFTKGDFFKSINKNGAEKVNWEVYDRLVEIDGFLQYEIRKDPEVTSLFLEPIPIVDKEEEESNLEAKEDVVAFQLLYYHESVFELGGLLPKEVAMLWKILIIQLYGKSIRLMAYLKRYKSFLSPSFYNSVFPEVKTAVEGKRISYQKSEKFDVDFYLNKVIETITMAEKGKINQTIYDIFFLGIPVPEENLNQKVVTEFSDQLAIYYYEVTEFGREKLPSRVHTGWSNWRGHLFQENEQIRAILMKKCKEVEKFKGSKICFEL